MKNRRGTPLLVLALCCLAACTRYPEVQIESTPPGATVRVLESVFWRMFGEGSSHTSVVGPTPCKWRGYFEKGSEGQVEFIVELNGQSKSVEYERRKLPGTVKVEFPE